MTGHTCSYCGAANAAEDEFCHACGSALRAGPPGRQPDVAPPPGGFVIGAVLRDAWQATLQNLPFLVLFTLVAGVIEWYTQWELPDRLSNEVLAFVGGLAILSII